MTSLKFATAPQSRLILAVSQNPSTKYSKLEQRVIMMKWLQHGPIIEVVFPPLRHLSSNLLHLPSIIITCPWCQVPWLALLWHAMAYCNSCGTVTSSSWSALMLSHKLVRGWWDRQGGVLCWCRLQMALKLQQLATWEVQKDQQHCWLVRPGYITCLFWEQWRFFNIRCGWASDVIRMLSEL
jgi:hypothetical protein